MMRTVAARTRNALNELKHYDLQSLICVLGKIFICVIKVFNLYLNDA